MGNSQGPRTYPLYPYTPSLAAAVIFCIVFMFATFAHLYRMIKSKAWFLTLFIVGGFFESIAYAARASSASSEPGHYRLMPFIIQNTFILLAPALFAATVYMFLARIISVTDGETHSLIKPRWITKTFLAGDLFCFLLQSAGGGLTAKDMTSIDASSSTMGKNIILAGLFIQLVWFIIFVVVAALFHRRMLIVPTAAARQKHIPWQKHVRSLYLASGLIIVRSLIRFIEYAEGYDGYIASHEAFLYIFDTLLMFLVMIWMYWQHPSEISILLRKKRAGGEHVLYTVT